MKQKSFLLLLVLALLLTGCGGGDAPEAQADGELLTVRLPMGYIPNVQYAPFYVAVEKGYFAEAGMELIFDYSFETDGVVLVGAEELMFAVVSGEQVLLARAQGLPVVYFMAWFQGYPTAVVAKAETGVETPADLAGHQIGLPGPFGASYIGLRALLNAGGVSEEDVTLNAIGFNQVEAMLAGQEDIIVGYATNEPVQLRRQGMDVNVIVVEDHVDLASNGIITNEAMIAENPELVQAFVQALSRGIQDTIADPEEAYEICMLYVEGLEDLDQEVQMEVLELSIEFWVAERTGYNDPASWENMQEVLLDMELLTEPQDLDAAFTNEFIP